MSSGGWRFFQKVLAEVKFEFSLRNVVNGEHGVGAEPGQCSNDLQKKHPSELWGTRSVGWPRRASRPFSTGDRSASHGILVSTCPLLFLAGGMSSHRSRSAAPTTGWGAVGLLCEADGCWGWGTGVADRLERRWVQDKEGHSQVLSASESRPAFCPRWGGGWTLPRGSGKHICLGLVVARRAFGLASALYPCRTFGILSLPELGSPFHEASGTPGCTPEASGLGGV